LRVPPRAPTLLGIQVLRAVAALTVMLVHLSSEIALKLGQAPLPGAAFFGIGVDLFFVISGFIIVYASETLFQTPRGGRTFFLRRLLRIAPIYYVATAILLIHVFARYDSLAAANMSWVQLWTSLLFIPYPAPNGDITPILVVGWTLNYEMFFYLLFALAVFLPRTQAVVATAAVLTAGRPGIRLRDADRAGLPLGRPIWF
jgi:exopolysaccharide production protein ExoZ